MLPHPHPQTEAKRSEIWSCYINPVIVRQDENRTKLKDENMKPGTVT